MEKVFDTTRPILLIKETKMRSLKWILLGVYLILAGLMLLGVNFPLAAVIAGVCALIAGVLFIINR
jgi:hypothetical protein